MSDRPAISPDAAHSVVEWFAAQPSSVRPDLAAGLVRDAAIVGLGVSTREGHETFQFVDDTTRLLLDAGFDTIAVFENQRVADLYDRYIAGEDIDIDLALAQAWGPWQIMEMRQALVWLRDHNRTRSTDRVRVIGINSSHVLVADYGRIVELLTAIDQKIATEVEALVDVIRVAHDVREHVLHAQGTHPGTPFVELARAARATAAALDPGAERDAALELLDAVVDFHANAIGVGYDMVREERAAADRLLDHHHRTGERIVLWEGSGHIAAHPGPMLGSHLRAALGDRYVAVHVTFGHGRITRADIPAPRSDSVEAYLANAGGERTIDLRTHLSADVAGQLERPWPTRLISGIYDPAQDDQHYFDLPSMTDSFDALVFIPTITPVTSLHDAT